MGLVCRFGSGMTLRRPLPKGSFHGQHDSATNTHAVPAPGPSLGAVPTPAITPEALSNPRWSMRAIRISRSGQRLPTGAFPPGK